MIDAFLFPRLIGSLLTLYMIAILLRWSAPYIEIDLQIGRLRWLPRVTDPALNLMRRVLPDMGPVDWSPFAVLLAAWVLRRILAGY